MMRRLTLSLLTGLTMLSMAPCFAGGQASGSERSDSSGTNASISAPTLSESASQTLLKLQTLLHEHHPDQALTLANHTLEGQPDNGSVMFLKARALTDLGQQDEAITLLKNLIERFPEMAAPYNNLAALYAAHGQLNEARQVLEKGVIAQPNYAIAQENLGDIYVALARDAYSQALKLNPDNRALKLKASKLNQKELHP